MARFFINRPIVAIVISIVMVILGGISLSSLPREQYPDIVPPTIRLMATYPGADSKTVADAVASPIEQQLAGVDNMAYMTSSNANNGMMLLNIVFDVGSDPNTDQILSYIRYAQSTSQLPQEVSQMGVTMTKSTGVPLLLYSITSPNGTHDNVSLTNYAYLTLVDELKRINGVGDVQVYGADKYAMRVWLDPDRLTALNLSVDEVVQKVKEQNTVNPAGKIGGEPAPAGQEFTYTVRAKGRLITEEEFGNIIIRSSSNAIVRLKDIAKVTLGASTYNNYATNNGNVSSLISISQSPGTNAIKTADAAEALLAKVALEPDMELTKVLDTTLAVREGIREIVTTLFETLALVILVVFVFLQGFRATLIPLFAVPVSIIGTFAFFPLLGFTINTICLMSVVLAIGLVVDDAIVVVEAVEHHIEEGKSPREATIAAMDEVSGPVIAIALVLSAVFLPTLLLPGITGSLFQQFAVTIALSILISAFNALTLSPALSAMMLKPKDKERRGIFGNFYRLFDRIYGRAQNGYVRLAKMLVRKFVIVLIILAGMTAIIPSMSSRIPGGFLPEEDQGFLFVSLTLDDAKSLQMTAQAADKVTNVMKEIPGIDNIAAVSGFNLLTNVQCTNNAFFFITLKPWEERQTPELKSDALTRLINARLKEKVPDGIAFCFAPPAIPGIGATGGVTLMLEDQAGNGQDFLDSNTNIFMQAVSARTDIFSSVNNSMAPTVPQYYVEVNEEKAAIQGVSSSAIYGVLQTYMGSMFVNYFTQNNRQYQVYLQAQEDARSDISLLDKFYVPGKDGSKVPINSLIKVQKIFAPEFLLRQNQYNASQLNISGQPGVSSTQMMQTLEEIFEKNMPTGMGMEYSGMSYQEQQAQEGVSLPMIFILSAAFVFLILAALYESWSLPVSIFLTVPVAVVGAFGGLLAIGLELNLYAQIGLIMLIGLAAKNAILIVEFAVIEMERGKTLFEATISSAELRLRPILMTSFAFIFGCVPLAIASGSGALARQVIGVSVISGMLIVTAVGIFLIPACFYFVKRMTGMKPDDTLTTIETKDTATTNLTDSTTLS